MKEGFKKSNIAGKICIKTLMYDVLFDMQEHTGSEVMFIPRNH